MVCSINWSLDGFGLFRKVITSTDCTYDQQSTPKRYSGNQYIEMLENKLQRMETLFRAILPHIDVDDPNLDASGLHQMPAIDRDRGHQIQTTQATSALAPLDIRSDEAERDSLLETILEAAGRLDLDDQGRWDYYGHSSGPAFLRRLGEQFEGLVGPEIGKNPFLRIRPIPDVPWSSEDFALSADLADISVLPSKELARELVSNALDDACALMRFVHRPTFDRMFYRIYEVNPENYGDEDGKFLSLFYSVMALGCLFSKSELTMLGSTFAKSEG
jgi:hypothetical protein